MQSKRCKYVRILEQRDRDWDAGRMGRDARSRRSSPMDGGDVFDGEKVMKGGGFWTGVGDVPGGLCLIGILLPIVIGVLWYLGSIMCWYLMRLRQIVTGIEQL
ncbi:hypothetical protein JTE90_009444 [Oedothorax gibbosus]|uniref:Uncharacterized protein n=1 Tax=Oedothorax gibbosus TaxID=931172 RepID=A0AAV6VUW3_9ARAC|nr:hypothetical protein JTE90_009444 [Oedothorax gibbosus]